jgi:hypothetical protein
MAANQTEFDQKLVDLTQDIRASTESDKASTARRHAAEVQQTILQPTEGIIAGAAVAKPVAKIPQTGRRGDSLGSNEGNCSHSQMSAETVQGRVEVGNGCSEVKSHFGRHLLTPETRLYTQHIHRHPGGGSCSTAGEVTAV